MEFSSNLHNPTKVIWTGAITDLSGYAQASREYVRSLLSVGIEVSLECRSFEPWKPTHLVENIVGRELWDLTGKEHDAKVHVIHLTPDLYPEYNHPNRIKVGLFAWETNRLPGHWVKNINEILQELWVPCEWLKNVSLSSGVTIPVFVVPHAIPLPLEGWVPTYEISGMVPEVYKFYTIAQWSGRKNIPGLVWAYYKEFSREDPVILVLKTYRVGNSQDQKDFIRKEISKLKRETKGMKAPRILLIEDFLSTEEVNAIHYYGDCYITMTRSEGFGLGCFEAAAFGNPVIVPNHTAFSEHWTAENSYPIKIRTESKVSEMRHISVLYSGDMTWYEPDITDCQAKMRYVFNNQESAKSIGQLGKEYIGKNLKRTDIGVIMKARIEALLKRK